MLWNLPLNLIRNHETAVTPNRKQFILQSITEKGGGAWPIGPRYKVFRHVETLFIQGRNLVPDGPLLVG